MALPINIDQLLSGHDVESTRIEYKEGWNPETTLHTICAFANDIENLGGGYIIIGIAEKEGVPEFPVKGIPKNSIDKINKELLNICNKIEPRYIPEVETVKYQNKNLIIVWIYGGINRPYKCPISLSEKRDQIKAYYIRKASSTIKANSKDEKELFSLSENIPFDDRINNKSEIEDLRPALISNYLYEVKSELYESSLTLPLKTLAKSLRIIDGPSEYLKPINVGLMFFNERPDNYFKYARIEVVDKPDETGIGMTEKYFTGPLDRQLKDALEFIKNYAIKEKIIKFKNKAEADRIYNYPYAAVEEALSNAVHHKSYQIPEPIVVTITPYNIEILSSPGPDKSISMEKIRSMNIVSTRYRNRRIGEFLKELKLVEGRNTGIPTMIRALENNGSEKPIFETDEDRTFFRVTIPVHKIFLEKREKTSEKPVTKIKRTKEQLKADIIKELSRDSFSSSELAEKLGYSSPYGKRFSEVINELKAEGVIIYSNPDKMFSKGQKLILIK